MTRQIRRSDDQGWFYVIDIDDQGNETVVRSELSEAEARELAPGSEPVLESETKRTKDLPVQDDRNHTLRD